MKSIVSFKTPIVLATLVVLVASTTPTVAADADATAELVWASVWDGPASHNDEVDHIFADSEGGAILVGKSSVVTDLGQHDAVFVQRLSPTGMADWTTFPADTAWSVPLDAMVHGDRVVVATFTAVDTVGLVAVTRDGGEAWSTLFPLPANLLAGSRVVLASGPADRLHLAAATPTSTVLAVFGPEGEIEQSSVVTHAQDGVPVLDLLVDDTGRRYLGIAQIAAGSPGLLTVLAVEPSGEVAWQHDMTSDIGSAFPFLGLAFLPDGDLAVAGNLESICGIHRLTTWRLDVVDGALLWSDVLGDDPCDSVVFVDLAVDDAGGIAVVGVGTIADDSNWDYVLVRYTAEGERLWYRQFAAAEGSTDQARALTARPEGETLVTGRSFGPPPQTARVFTVAVDPGGSERWRQLWDLSPGIDADATAMALDPDGDVFVAGMTHGGQFLWDALALRYHPLEPTSTPPAATPNLRVHALLNPFGSSTRVRYSLPRGGAFSLSVFDVRGRRVRLLRQGHATAGEHAATWAGRGDRGRPLPSGTYLLRLETPSGVATQRVSLLR